MADIEQDTKPPETTTDSPYRRRLALVIAFVAVLAATAAAASSVDDSRADRTHREAQQSGVTALAETSVGLGRYHGERDRWELDNELVTRAEASRTARLLLDRDLGPAFGVDALRADLGRAAGDLRWGATVDGRTARFGAAGERGTEASLRADAAKQTAEDWSAKADAYFMVVTLLAVVLTLLGLASTIAGDHPGRFLWPAGIVAVIAAVVGIGAFATPVARVEPTAITASAEGDLLVSRRAPREAVAAYDRAVVADPDYAYAWRARALAVVAAGSLGARVGVTQADSSPDAYRAAVGDLERARDLGLDDPALHGLLGAVYFHLRRYDESIESTDRALESGPNAVFISNRGLSLAALGRGDEARVAYRQFVEQVLPRGASDVRVPVDLVATAVTALEKLVVLEPDRAELAKEIEAELIAGGQGSAPPDASVTSRADLTATPTGLEMQLSTSAVTPGSPRALLVSARTQGGGPWIVRPDMSVFDTWPASREEARHESLMRADLSCAPIAEYRVEVFAGTRRLSESMVTSRALQADQVAFFEPQSRLRGCRPVSWRAELETWGVALYRAPDGSRLSVRSLSLVPGEGGADAGMLLGAASSRIANAVGVAHAPPVGRAFPGIAGLARSSDQVSTWVGRTESGVLVSVTLAGNPGVTGPVLDTLATSPTS